MRIITRASPNHNERCARVDMLVLHYTGMESAQAALSRLADPQAGVSAHYVVLETGVIVRMVDESRRAWHAGVSRWQGDDDLNSRSVGVEIVNGGHDFPAPDGGLPAYPQAQVAAVISLSQAILARHAIPATRIVGHSDIAPLRKRDPGEHFPWQQLAKAGIGIWPQPPEDTAETGAPASMMQMQQQLAEIGYDLAVTGVPDPQTGAAVSAFQRRWCPLQVSGQADANCRSRVAAVASAYRGARG